MIVQASKGAVMCVLTLYGTRRGRFDGEKFNQKIAERLHETKISNIYLAGQTLAGN